MIGFPNFDNVPLTEDWLSEIGFKWSQMPRQPNKHWVLWIGEVLGRYSAREDLGIEVTSNTNGDWSCWLRSDTAHAYSRFLHIRYLRGQRELIAVIQGLTYQEWKPENVWYGALVTDEHATYLREQHERLDRRIAREVPWNECEKDPSRAYLLNDHQRRIEGKE